MKRPVVQERGSAFTSAPAAKGVLDKGQMAHQHARTGLRFFQREAVEGEPGASLRAVQRCANRPGPEVPIVDPGLIVQHRRAIEPVEAAEDGRRADRERFRRGRCGSGFDPGRARR